jgi:nitroimidazol reductase NimA-like FMN-containing flavoprotein (pyridoxamine 5'-phosphate oxidase superfamily)
MRAMRRAEREIVDEKELERIVAQGKVCRLGMIDGDEPYVVPVSYGYRHRTVYIHSASVGRKIAALQAHPRVCLEFEGECKVVAATMACGWSMHCSSVIAWGQAAFLGDRAAIIDALNVIMAHYGGPAVSPSADALDKVVLIQVAIDAWTGKRLA